MKNFTGSGGCSTHKRGYPSKAKATKALRHGHAAESRARSVYHCRSCGQWHLTKQRTPW